MVSKKLKLIFALSVPIYMAHTLEELFTDFYRIDPHYDFLFRQFSEIPVLKATFVLGIFMGWFWMITCLLLLNPKWQLWVAILPGLLYVFELHHLLDIAEARTYMPGAITGMAYPILVVVYWKQWLKEWGARRWAERT